MFRLRWDQSGMKTCMQYYLGLAYTKIDHFKTIPTQPSITVPLLWMRLYQYKGVQNSLLLQEKGNKLQRCKHLNTNITASTLELYIGNPVHHTPNQNRFKRRAGVKKPLCGPGLGNSGMKGARELRHASSLPSSFHGSVGFHALKPDSQTGTVGVRHTEGYTSKFLNLLTSPEFACLSWPCLDEQQSWSK